MARKRIGGSISVDVDLDDVCDALDEDDLKILAEQHGFKLAPENPAEEIGADDAEIIRSEIRYRRTEEALIHIERAYPITRGIFDLVREKKS